MVKKWIKLKHGNLNLLGFFFAWSIVKIKISIDSIKGHNSDVFKANWLVIKRGQDVTHTDILCKFSEDPMKTDWVRERTKKFTYFVLITIYYADDIILESKKIQKQKNMNFFWFCLCNLAHFETWPRSYGLKWLSYG